jgi:hypothetical protein
MAVCKRRQLNSRNILVNFTFFKKSVKYLLDDHPDSSLPHYLVGLQRRAILLLFVKSGASRRVILYVDCRRGRVGMFDLDEAAGV